MRMLVVGSFESPSENCSQLPQPRQLASTKVTFPLWGQPVCNDCLTHKYKVFPFCFDLGKSERLSQFQSFPWDHLRSLLRLITVNLLPNWALCQPGTVIYPPKKAGTLPYHITYMQRCDSNVSHLFFFLVCFFFFKLKYS